MHVSVSSTLTDRSHARGASLRDACGLGGSVDIRLPLTRNLAPHGHLRLHVGRLHRLRALTQSRLEEVDDVLRQAATVMLGRSAQRVEQVV